MMFKKVISSGICDAINRYLKANNKYMKKLIKTKNHHSFSI